MENELREINRIIRRIENLQILEKNQNTENENMQKKNEAKIEELKGKIQQNQNWQQSFKPEEPEYQEFSKENEELKQQIATIEKENRVLIGNGMDIRSGKANLEVKEKIEKEKQELKEKINNQRKFLIRNRNVNIQEKMAELNEKRKRFRSDIEASERGIKIEEEVAKRTGNDEALKFKKKMLEKRIKEFEENETEIKKYGELAELFAIGDVLKEIERLDLMMKEIDKLSIENVEIDRNVFVDKLKEKMNKMWGEAIKEDQMREEAKKKQQEEEAKRKQQEEEAKKKQQDKKVDNDQRKIEPVKLKYKEIDLEQVENLCVEILDDVKLPENWIETEEAQKIVKELQEKCELLEKGLENEATLTDKEKNRLNEIFDELKNFSISKEIIDKIKKKLEKQTEQNENSDKYKDILDDPEADPNRDKRLPIDIEVNLGRKGYVIYDGKKYKISKKELKKIPFLDYSDIKEIIEKSGIEIKKTELLKEALLGKNIDYAVVKGILSANKMDNEIKVNILNTYLKECLQMEDCIRDSKFEEAYAENKCNVIYNLKDLSRAGGMHEYEKNEFLMRVGKAHRFNIGEPKGEYKPSLIARTIAKLKGSEMKMLGQYEEEVGRRAEQIAYKEQTVPRNKIFVKALREQAYTGEVDFGTYKDEQGNTIDAGQTTLNWEQMSDVDDVVQQLSEDFDGRD